MSADILLLGGIAVAAGFFIGAVGVGGILLIPFLAMLGGLSIHEAAATALFSFLFTGLLGTWLYQRRGSIDWGVTVPVCGSTVVFSYLGALANSRIGAGVLTLTIGLMVVSAGCYLLLPPPRGPRRRRDSSHRLLLIGVGAVSGFLSGLSGAGGPLFSVPLMLLLGFVPLIAIGASQVLQIAAATFGTLGNLAYGSVDFGMASWITICQLGGIVIGARTGHAISAIALRRMAAGLCMAAGLFMLAR